MTKQLKYMCLSDYILTDVNELELSVSYISSEINKISTELSTELCCCELSIAGISSEVNNKVNKISEQYELSNYTIGSYLKLLTEKLGGTIK